MGARRVTVVIRPVAVVGPTATGKSELGLDLAEALGGEVVNIDAMQQYRGMDIGTAKLAPAERRGIAHHRLDVLDVTDTATVARYQEAAVVDVEDIIARARVPIIVGGSMMYVQSLLDQWAFPATDPEVRARWERVLADGGTDAVHRALHEHDPEAAASILPTDGRRIVRALEVVEPRWGTRILGVDRDTTELDERIARRTDLMFTGGLVEEVRSLVEIGLRDGVTASRAIGYAQVLDFLDGRLELDAARERTFIGTRRYVRRQRSWFRRDPRIQWLDGADTHMFEQAVQALGE